MAHVIHENKIAVCGERVWSHEWAYQSVEHVLAAIERNETPVEPCQRCMEAISAGPGEGGSGMVIA